MILTKKIISKDYKAFTLAEVLITLGIIGIVAALTIPALINEYKKMVYVTALKKFYSQYNQALIEATNEAGCAGDLSCVFTTGTNKDFDTITNQFKIVQKCQAASPCFAPFSNIDGTNQNQEPMWYLSYSAAAYFVTADGMSVAEGYFDTPKCAKDYSDHSGKDLNLTKVCGEIVVDINGVSQPNRLGRDVFIFYLTNGHGAALYPNGKEHDGHSGYWAYGCLPEYGYGRACSGRIADSGWKMDY